MSTSVRVQGFCPACGESMLDTVRASHGAWSLRCRYVNCPDPEMANKILADSEVEHVIEFTLTDFTVRHPLRERAGDDLFTCRVHKDHARMDRAPVEMPGRYRVLDFIGPDLESTYRYELLLGGVAG